MAWGHVGAKRSWSWPPRLTCAAGCRGIGFLKVTHPFNFPSAQGKRILGFQPQGLVEVSNGSLEVTKHCLRFASTSQCQGIVGLRFRALLKSSKVSSKSRSIILASPLLLSALAQLGCRCRDWSKSAILPSKSPPIILASPRSVNASPSR